MNSGQDPYRVEPLRSCEERLATESGEGLIGGVVIPAPLPAYALAPFRLLALAPFAIARELFTLAIVISATATVVVVQRLTRRPLIAVAGVLIVADAYVSVLTGQIAAIAVAAAVLAAAALARERPREAGAWATLALVEPHLGLPVVLGLAVCVPRARGVLAAGVALLGVVTLTAPHLGYVFEYLGTVLPMHLRSELYANEQLGVAPAIAALGAPPAAAMRLASIAYAAAVAAALVALRRANVAPADPIVALAPLAIAVAVAPYSHVTQACAAIPLLAIVAARGNGTVRAALASAGLALVAIPWVLFSENLTAPFAAAVFGLATAVAAASIAGLRRGQAVVLVVLDAAVAATIAAAQSGHPSPGASLIAELSRSAPSAFADANWQIFVEGAERDTNLGLWLAKGATWAGLAIAAALALSTRPDAEPIPGT